VLATKDILVDVGAVYDPAIHRYDHHQASFTETFDDKHKTKLSSAGLIYKHFGREVVQKILNIKEDDPSLDVIYQRMYDVFIESVDAVDNGIERFDSPTPAKYTECTTLGARVGRLNPSWVDTDPDEWAGFEKAMEMTGKEFNEILLEQALSWYPARSIVEEALANAFGDGNQLVKLGRFCPWKGHLDDLEKEQGIVGRTKYCLYGDASGWRIQAVAIAPGSFQSRLPLPAPWRGVRDEELSKLTGVDGCVFVHSSGFIGGNKTYEGALEMATKALNFEKKK